MQGIDPELAIKIANTSPLIAYDTETTGLDYDADVVGYVITDKEHSIYVPVRHKGGGNIINGEQFEKELAAAFRNRERLGLWTVGHNMGFDMRMGGKRGVMPGYPCGDTQINEALIDDRTIGYGLDDCSKRHGVTVKLGADLYAEIARRFNCLPDRKSMKHFADMPGDHPLVVDYACGDGVSTIELWEKQMVLIEQEELHKPHDLECRLIPKLARMHLRGLRVDADYAGKVVSEAEAAIKLALEEFPAGFNPASPNDVEKLFRDNGYTDDMFARTEPTPKAPQGQLSFAEKWLKTNAIGEKILGVRQLNKAVGSFITPLIDTHNHAGRVHPVLHQSKGDDYGVAGARLSCSEPNLQAFPKRNKRIGKLVRPLVAFDEGMTGFEADANQQEPRFFTHYSEEPALVEGYRNSTADIHDRASEALGLDREVAKRLGLGMLTMMSPKTLMGHMGGPAAGWPLQRCKDAHAAFLTDAFPAIGKFQQTAVNVFKSRGYVKSILGRRARIESNRFAYQAISRIIQNGGGDHMKTCLLDASDYVESLPAGRAELLMSIHDSIIGQYDDGHPEVLKEILRIVEAVPHKPDFNLIVPIPFECIIGKDWGQASYGQKVKLKTGWIDGW